MADIALFHSVLGVRPGIHDAAQRLRAAGHEVLVVDQYEGRVFDDYEEAGAFSGSIGYPELVRRGLEAVAALPDGLVAAGFSNGAAMAEVVATQRRCSGALLLSGALPLGMLGASSWPAVTPVQVHYAEHDPFRRREWVDALLADVSASGSGVEQFDYPGAGHLFTDPGLPAEHDAQATELLWERALTFVGAVTTSSDRRPAPR